MNQLREIVEQSPYSVIAASMTGSRLYGLSHPESDWDYHLIVNQKNASSHVILNKEDVRVTGINLFVERLFANSISEVDMVYAKQIQFTDASWKPLIQGFRYNPLTYYKNSYALVLKLLPTIKTDVSDNQKQRKTLRSLLRHAILAERAQELKEDFSPLFSSQQRELFNRSHRILVEEFSEEHSLEAKADLLSAVARNF